MNTVPADEIADGGFLDKMSSNYVYFCLEGATNLDIRKMGKYPFCKQCGKKSECQGLLSEYTKV
jgi:hypothetical protein